MDLDRDAIERSFRRRVLAVLLGAFIAAFAVPVPATMAFASKSITRPIYLSIVLIYVAAFIVAITAVFLNFAKRVRPLAVDRSTPPDIEEQKRLRRGIRRLLRVEILLALALLYGLWVSQDLSWPIIVGCGISLLMQFALIRTILRLRKRLRQAALTG